jgi:hypothetical protein
MLSGRKVYTGALLANIFHATSEILIEISRVPWYININGMAV